MDPARRLLPLGLCIALCLWGTVAQNHGVQAVPAPAGTTGDCNSHMLCPANAKCVNSTHCTCLDGYQPHGNRFFTDPTETCDDINECLGPSPPDCGRIAHCNNVPGSYYCTCSDGYEPSSGKANFTHASENSCRDIDECQGPSPADCGPHANCTNVPGSYYCTCIDGYEPSSGKANFTHRSENSCRDIDECQGPSPADCGPHANCTNVPGSYYCTCIDGYEPSSGKANFTHRSENSCRDIDECQGPSPADCGPHGNCTNVPGSYYCSCIDGYEPSSGKAKFTHMSENSCQDIDECQGPSPADCGPHANCTNVPGSYYCTCIDGYEPSSGKANFTHRSENSCRDIDECQGPSPADCGPHANCTNVPGSYYCTCIDGYEPSSGKANFTHRSENSCRDIDECQGPSPADCGPHGNCTNVPGSYYCSCIDGYEPSSGKAKFTHMSENSCQDIDECQGPSPADCGPHANCTNVPGSYNCTCIDGYEPSSGKANFTHASENSCRDIDECLGPSPPDCGPHANCTNTPGSYFCTCIDGYEPSSGKANFTCASENSCQDIDECNKTPDICGPNATCINTIGSYWCECRAGYVPSNRNTTLCQELTCPQLLDDDNSAGAKNLLGSFQTQGGSLCKAALEELKQMNSQDAEGKLQGSLAILEKQINLVGQQSESVERRHRIATELMALVEKLLGTLGLTVRDRISIASPNGTELGLVVRQAGNQSQETVTLQQSKTQMELKWARAPGQKNEGFTLAGLVTYQGMSPILDGAGRVEAPEWDKIGRTGKWAQKPGRPSYRVLSPVVSAFISDPNPQALDLSVSIRFSHPVPENKTDLSLLCAYWEPGSRRWATDGCTLQKLNATITRCQCNHLTSFAVLMAFYELEDWTLDVITKVGLVISLLCLLLAIVTFLFCRALKGPRTTIHLHLCLALFIAYTVFLTGTSSTGNKVVCRVVAGLLHYFFLAAFCWMCLEGAELYLLVVQVFTPHGLRRRYMFLLGYGVPALIVGVSAATYSQGYGTARHCWLSLEKQFIWSFLAPVCIIILVNAVIFVVTVWKLSLKFADINPDMSQLKKLRVLTITAIAQLCILGTTWIFGMFQFNQRSLVASYIFTVLNSLQGLFIFLLHCLLKKQVRDEYRRWLSCGGLKGPAKSSEFSSSTITRQGLQPSQDSGF
ncbi:adhesion G protein-coupled receptor E5-like isoform X5 [Mauremys reevesii]|uniref:adhesion G protein-coupled receptor E5-like isoform X5 n=1 Tax=Mauremys reevesii TaxID=260615 RepID=UPI00193F2D05|nr:adhesion G protein-coupled receptor E5-like isoform X5 [Mauremys reevesii]